MSFSLSLIVSYLSSECGLKKIVRVRLAPAPHWVGDGLRVQALLTYESHGQMLSPFLMLDDGAHCLYKPTTQARGVGSHLAICSG